MLRDDFDISDADFDAVIKPFEKKLNQYIVDNFLYDYIAYYLATGFRYNALWTGNLSAHLASSIDSLASVKIDNDIAFEKINEILEKKYNLIIVNAKPLKFESTKKEDQQLS